jgi:CRP/FNR family transcriptional regulator, cyclic AMP receptor protein
VTPTRHFPVTVCHVLREDIGLSEAIPIADRDKAIEECIAPAAWIPAGPWSGPQTDIMPDGIGLLVLQGLLIRHVRVTGRFSSELLGEGDLLRPWQGEQPGPTLRHTTDWRVLERTRVALLDGTAAHRFAQYPELTGRLVARAIERSRSLAMNMAIVQQPLVQIRLRMLLWLLAERWGYVRPEGTILPLRLTHDVLADLVAARRPTVSSALAHLAKNELVRPCGDGWLLLRHPPDELPERQHPSARG